jgi:hypothetical protein
MENDLKFHEVKHIKISGALAGSGTGMIPRISIFKILSQVRGAGKNTGR